MGSRDYRHREAKKPKKSAKSAPVEAILPTQAPAEVEVIRKKRKAEEAEAPES